MVSQGVSVVVMTLNEEENIAQCLESVVPWSDDVHIVDSDSSDDTVLIGKEFTDNIHQMKDTLVGSYEYANMRNWVIENIEFKYDWLLFLDADERATEKLKKEIDEVIQYTDRNGFYIYRRFIFLGKWLRHGRNYFKEIRLYRPDKTRYVEQGAMDYAAVDGYVGTLDNDLIHDDKKSISDWVNKHNITAKREARKLAENDVNDITSNLDDDVTVEGEGRQWIIENVWNRTPLIIRPFVLFFYVFIIQGGFLDGVRGFVYYVHHDFWYYLLIYTHYIEMEDCN
jgi:glycosyltransferase involved in cell wall biosynthesis